MATADNVSSSLRSGRPNAAVPHFKRCAKIMLFEHPWPNDIPSSCPLCGNEFRTGINLAVGPGRAARLVKCIAHGMILPWMLIAVVLLLCFDMPNGGLAGGYAILGFMFIPSLIMAILGSLLPTSRRVSCKCGYHKDYSALPSREKEAQSGPRE